MRDKGTKILSVILLFIYVALLFVVLKDTQSEVHGVHLDVKDRNARVFMTADHLPEESFEGCKKIYSDEENDIAIYYNNAYIPVHPVKGENIIVDDCIEGTLVDISDTHIVIEVNDPMDIHSGLSGTSVKNDTGNVIAYVIEMVSENELRAVLY